MKVSPLHWLMTLVVVIYCSNFLFSFLVYLDPPAAKQLNVAATTSVEQHAVDDPTSTSEEHEKAASAEVTNEQDNDNPK